MKTNNDKNRCRSVRKERCGVIHSIKMRLFRHLDDHVSECPKCQKRLVMVNRVEVALMLVKSEPYEMGLLARANSKALDVLTHSLRFTPKSTHLRQVKSDPNYIEKAYPLLERVLNVAACLFVIIMIKTGVSNSLLDYKDQGESVIHNYYARNLDTQMFDEIFPSDSPSTG
jgi:hypothetical protein